MEDRPDWLPAVIIIAIVFAAMGAVVFPWLTSVQEDCITSCLKLGIQHTRDGCNWECSGRLGGIP
jgi:hypothetical protein